MTALRAETLSDALALAGLDPRLAGHQRQRAPVLSVTQ
jgi:hypothetical protein